MIPAASRPRKIARICGVLALSTWVLSVLVAVIPFYTNGIYLHSYAEIYGSQVDIKGYPPYTWPVVGLPLLWLAHLAYIFTPGLIIIALMALTLVLLINWRTFSLSERLHALVTFTIMALILVGTGSIWRTLGVWIAD
jgi:hypothetical protein